MNSCSFRVSCPWCLPTLWTKSSLLHPSTVCLQGGPHQIGGKDIEVKAALPRNYGGSTQLVDKLFVGGLPVRALGLRIDAGFAAQVVG